MKLKNLILILTAAFLLSLNLRCNSSYSNKNIIESDALFLEKLFQEHEIILNRLYKSFKAKLPCNRNLIVTVFRELDCHEYGITIYPLNGPVNVEKKVWGGEHLPYNSDELEEVLVKLNWGINEVETINNLLIKTKSIWIRNTEIDGLPIEIFTKEAGYGSYSYFIFEDALTTRQKEIHGRPLKLTLLKDRVVLKYSSSL
jgi:hypothetical protein